MTLLSCAKYWSVAPGTTRGSANTPGPRDSVAFGRQISDSSLGRGSDDGDLLGGGVGEGAGDQGARRAVLVGDHAGEGARDAVDQILDREREGERLPRPAEIQRHRLQVQAEAVPRSERDREYDPAAQEHGDRGSPAVTGRRTHRGIVADRDRWPDVHLPCRPCVTVDAEARAEGQYDPSWFGKCPASYLPPYVSPLRSAEGGRSGGSGWLAQLVEQQTLNL